MLCLHNGCGVRRGTCVWMHDMCYVANSQWMTFQSYPLEAALATLLTSILNVFTFYPMYVSNGVTTIVSNILLGSWTSVPPMTMSPGSNNVQSAEAQKFIAAHVSALADIQKAPRSIIIFAIKFCIIPIRDLVFAFYELVRAAVYVAEPNDLGKDEFQMFTRVMRDTTNTLEMAIESMTEALLDLVTAMMNILFDFVQLFVGKSNPDKFVHDIVTTLTKMLGRFSETLFKIILQIPGFEFICEILFGTLADPINILLTAACTIMGTVNEILTFLSIHVLDGVSGMVCKLHIDKTMCSSGIDTANVNTYEPSVCITDAGCGASSFCMVNGNETLCRYTNYLQANVLARAQGWDQPCLCTDFSDVRAYGFCNVATGFCQEGPSVFQPPLATCPSQGSMALIPPALGTLWEHQHSLCYVMPTWRCSDHSITSFGGPSSWKAADGTMAAALAALTACRWDLATQLDHAGNSMLEGPYLCSELCTPSVLHADNRLTQVTGPKGDMCACEVGISVGANHHFRPRTGDWDMLQLSSAWVAPGGLDAALDAQNLARLKIIAGGRRLTEAHQWTNLSSFDHSTQLYGLEYPLVYATTERNHTFCAHAFECEAPGTVCSSPWGFPVPCDGCPDAAECSAAACACVVPPVERGPLDRSAFDPAVWTGPARCDSIVRDVWGRNITELERAALEWCGVARAAGMAMSNYGVPADVFYNGDRIIAVAARLFKAVPEALAGDNVRAVALRHTLDPRLVATAIQVIRTVQQLVNESSHARQLVSEPVVSYASKAAHVYSTAVSNVWQSHAVLDVAPLRRRLLEMKQVMPNGTFATGFTSSSTDFGVYDSPATCTIGVRLGRASPSQPPPQ